MAAVVLTTSDLNGDHGASTVRVAIGDFEREIDLTDAQVVEARTRLHDIFAAGRPVDVGPRRVVPVTTHDWRDAVRYWARAAGHSNAERGRLRNEVLAAFQQEEPLIREWTSSSSSHAVPAGADVPPALIRAYTDATYPTRA